MATLPVPYTKHVSLPVGSSVKIKGTPAMPFTMFPEMEVDFRTGTEVDSDIAFQLRVYFDKCVVMNSRLKMIWNDEVKFTDMPFKDGQPFELGISVLSNGYQISVNGRQYTFHHRFSPESVKMIQVWRDVYLASVEVTA